MEREQIISGLMNHYNQPDLLNIQQYVFYENMVFSYHKGEGGPLNILFAHKYLFQEEKLLSVS